MYFPWRASTAHLLHLHGHPPPTPRVCWTLVDGQEVARMTEHTPAEEPVSPEAAEAGPKPTPWWRTRHVLVGAAAAVGAFAILQLALVIHVHYSYEGRYHSLFFPSSAFGLTKVEAEHGQMPVFHAGIQGWDGQFYYHMANDPFGLDPDTGKHIDNVTYRYQRVGVPLLTWAVARGTGQDFTTPFRYPTVQMAMASLGFGVLAGWLSALGVAWWWALCWLLAAGTVHSLFKGLPDAPADAAFAAAFVALWYRRLGWYSAFACLACLIREGYVVVPAAVFLLTAVGLLRWEGEPGLVRRTLLTALPVILVVCWAGYLAQHCGVALTSGQRSPPGRYGWPLQAFWACLMEARAHHLDDEFRYKLFSALTAVVVLALLLRNARRAPALLAVVPYALLMLCLGKII